MKFIPIRLASLLLIAFLVVVLHSGCGSGGQKSGRPDIDEMPREDLHGADIKRQLYELRAKVRKRGAAGAKQDLGDIIESVEAADKRRDVGQAFKETCKQIAEKLKTLQGAASKDAATKVADEIGTLADKLPGKAEQNPNVD